MNRAELTAVALEAREALRTMQEKKAEVPVGSVVISGMLADQLARELGRGAEPGAVVVRDPPGIVGAEVVVRVIAGDPGEAEDALVRAADAVGTPVVFVQLWPQENWRAPFVLSPFVIECRAGEGFPVADIATMIARSVASPEALAGRVPLLERPAESSAFATALARTALLGLMGARKKAPARPLITLAQLRMLSSLRASRGIEREVGASSRCRRRGDPRRELRPARGCSRGRAGAAGAVGQRGGRGRRDLGARGASSADPGSRPKHLLTPLFGSVRSGT